jgi:hypothetical protein
MACRRMPHPWRHHGAKHAHTAARARLRDACPGNTTHCRSPTPSRRFSRWRAQTAYCRCIASCRPGPCPSLLKNDERHGMVWATSEPSPGRACRMLLPQACLSHACLCPMRGASCPPRAWWLFFSWCLVVGPRLRPHLQPALAVVPLHAIPPPPPSLIVPVFGDDPCAMTLSKHPPTHTLATRPMRLLMRRCCAASAWVMPARSVLGTPVPGTFWGRKGSCCHVCFFSWLQLIRRCSVPPDAAHIESLDG